MELSKNIFFNTDKLIQNTKVKISYTGKLFQNQAEEVYLHYGFDNEWKELNEFIQSPPLSIRVCLLQCRIVFL